MALVQSSGNYVYQQNEMLLIDLPSPHDMPSNILVQYVTKADVLTGRYRNLVRRPLPHQCVLVPRPDPFIRGRLPWLSERIDWIAAYTNEPWTVTLPAGLTGPMDVFIRNERWIFEFETATAAVLMALNWRGKP